VEIGSRFEAEGTGARVTREVDSILLTKWRRPGTSASFLGESGVNVPGRSFQSMVEGLLKLGMPGADPGSNHLRQFATPEFLNSSIHVKTTF